MSTIVSAYRDPELSHLSLPPPPFDPPNAIYDAVARTLEAGGWPRLEGVVSAGSRVLIKPNFVTDRYYQERLKDRRLLASSTHASVIRPLVDFALDRGASEVVIADCPIEGCDLESVLEGLGFTPMIEALVARGLPVRFVDLRPFRIHPLMALDDVRIAGRSWNLGLLMKSDLPGDPLGYEVVDLGSRSRFSDVEERASRLRFHRANPETPVPHHSDGRHEYGIPRTVLESDVVIHVPKLKTHKKSGVTLSLKSSIGLCGYKYWLPHYTADAPPEGDEFPSRPSLAEAARIKLSRLPLAGGHSLVARAPRIGQHVPVTEGSWEANDTIWRTTLDLAAIHALTERDGTVSSGPARRTFALIDGIIGGEGEGPFGVTPVPSGLLLAADDPVLLDLVATEAMGYDWKLIPTVARAIERPFFETTSLKEMEVRWQGPRPDHSFTPPRSWPSLLPGAEPAEADDEETWAG